MMKERTMKKSSGAVIVMLALVISAVPAQTYLLPWNSFNAGGRPGAGTNLGLNGSIAQPVLGSGVAATSYLGWWGYWFGELRRDVSVVQIVWPLGSVDTLPKTPRARVRNLGQMTETFQVGMRIVNLSGVTVYTGSAQASSLLPGAETVLDFPVWGGHHDQGDYTARCSTSLPGDADQSNDLAFGLFTVLPVGGSAGVWVQKTSLPDGSRQKNIKDGGALAYGKEGAGGFANDTGYVYAFKGNGTYEFYRYNTSSNAWVSRESIPAYNRLSKKKAVKKGSSLAVAANGRVYATKGNGTYDWWEYDPGRPATARWVQKDDVPIGAKACKEGVSSVAVRLHYTDASDTDFVYLLKGSGTVEFYRYNIQANTWDTSLPPAPPGVSDKPFKNGSSITGDGGDTIFALKGSYNEFFAYSIRGGSWQTRDSLPRKSPPGTRKTKVKDGSQLAGAAGLVYALKGGNTDEFWTYRCDSHKWFTGLPVPTGIMKVKGGGALVYSQGNKTCYAFRGNNTREFWAYVMLTDDGIPGFDAGAMSRAGARIADYALRIGPNPFTRATGISFTLPQAANVSLKLYDVTGALVTTLASGFRPAGKYNLQLAARGPELRLASGVYLLRFESSGFTTTSKLIIE
jgi:hypothetical protein